MAALKILLRFSIAFYIRSNNLARRASLFLRLSLAYFFSLISYYFLFLSSHRYYIPFLVNPLHFTECATFFHGSASLQTLAPSSECFSQVLFWLLPDYGVAEYVGL